MPELKILDFWKWPSWYEIQQHYKIQVKLAFPFFGGRVQLLFEFIFELE